MPTETSPERGSVARRALRAAATAALVVGAIAAALGAGMGLLALAVRLDGPVAAFALWAVVAFVAFFFIAWHDHDAGGGA